MPPAGRAAFLRDRERNVPVTVMCPPALFLSREMEKGRHYSIGESDQHLWTRLTWLNKPPVNIRRFVKQETKVTNSSEFPMKCEQCTLKHLQALSSRTVNTPVLPKHSRLARRNKDVLKAVQLDDLFVNSERIKISHYEWLQVFRRDADWDMRCSEILSSAKW